MINNVSVSIAERSWFYRVSGNQVFSTDPADSEEITINTGDQRVTANLVALLGRREGVYFRADQNGALREVTSLAGRIRYWWNKREEQQRLVPVVREALEGLQDSLERLPPLNPHGEAALKEWLHTRFLANRGGTMARLSKAVFNRSAIRFGGVLERYLSEDGPGQSREALKACMKAHREGNDAAAKKRAIRPFDYAHRWAESQFADQLGLRFRSLSGGSGGARCGMTRSDHKVTVIKPGDEGPYGEHTPSWTGRLKQLLLSPRSSLRGNSEPRAEAGSSRLSDALDLGNVPTTKVEGVKGEFVGPKEKECSVQLFMAGAQTIREYLRISSRWQKFPPCLRWIFRRHLNRRQDLPPIPQQQLELSAVQKFISGDIDTHLDNVLIKTRSEDEIGHDFLNRYFRGEATNEEIDRFVDTMFQTEEHYFLLDRLFQSEEQIIVVNHDGGAAFVNRPPPSTYGPDGFLSSRYRFFFEVLPEFSRPFSEEIRGHLLNHQEDLARFILEHAIRELIGVSGYAGKTYTFRNFWQNPGNRQQFRDYILGEGGHHERLSRTLACLKVADLNVHFDAAIEQHFKRELTRIKGMADEMANRCRLLLHHLQEEREMPKRTLFLLSHQRPIEQKLATIAQSGAVQRFNEYFERYRQDPVLDQGIGDLPYDYHKLQHQAQDRVGELID